MNHDHRQVLAPLLSSCHHCQASKGWAGMPRYEITACVAGIIHPWRVRTCGAGASVEEELPLAYTQGDLHLRKLSFGIRRASSSKNRWDSFSMVNDGGVSWIQSSHGAALSRLSLWWSPEGPFLLSCPAAPEAGPAPAALSQGCCEETEGNGVGGSGPWRGWNQHWVPSLIFYLLTSWGRSMKKRKPPP